MAYRQTLAIWEKLAPENPTVSEYQNGLASTHSNLGVLYSATGNPT